MKKFILLPFLLFALLGCDSDDEAEFSIVGKKFKLKSFIIESSVDLNNDAIYSFDLVDETIPSPTNANNCFTDSRVNTAILEFEEDQLMGDIREDYLLFFQVENDNEGNLFQKIDCLVSGGALLFYEQNGTSIDFYIDHFGTLGTNGTFLYTGELSQNNTILTFATIDASASGDILKADGTIEQYSGPNRTATYIFELVED